MSRDAPRRQLTLFDSICIIVGIVIGAGVYETAPLIAGNVASVSTLMAVWLAGGLVSLAGALCYVELCTAYPREGGDFVFLSRAFGRRTGFMFAWCEYWIVRPGNVGMMAFVFARFANELFQNSPLSLGSDRVNFVAYAGGSIITLTVMNLFGVRAGKFTQNFLTAIKVIGLIAIFVVGMLVVPETAANQVSAATTSDFRLGLILVLFTYGGWNDISYVAAEVRDPQRNIFRSLVGGVALITLVYVFVNLAFVRALGLSGASSPTVAADLLGLQFGEAGRRAISLLVCLSCLGAINGTLFAGSRIYYAAGREHSVAKWLHKWSGRFDSPTRALLLQGIVTMGWVWLFGDEDGFEKLLIFTAPVFWFFAFLVGISLFLLRRKDADVSRPHRVWLYPWTPVLFCLSCAFMFYSSLAYAFSKWEPPYWSGTATWTIVVVTAGLIVSYLEPGLKSAAEEDIPPEDDDGDLAD